MILNKSENTFYVDIDDTLAMYDYTSKDDLIEFDYYGEKRLLREHKGHTSFLRALKKRGYHIVAWSANGGTWAYEVCSKLGLGDVIDECKTKPTRVLDDSKISQWCRTIFIKEQR